MFLQRRSSASPGGPETLCIGEWELTPALRTLRHPRHGVRPLRAMLVRLLTCLAERPGAVLTRDELVARIWEGRTVNEEALTRGISELRTILGDDRGEPRYVETIRGSGYRLIAAVRAGGDADPTPAGGRARRFAAVVAVVATTALVARVLAPGADVDEPRLWPRSTPLTTMPGRETDPAVSPDGACVAFSWGGEDDADYDVWVKDLDGDAMRRVTSGAGHDVHPAWSPDGSRIAFLRAGEDGTSLWVVPAAGGVPVHLADLGAWATGLDWSPDGRELLVARITDDAGLRLATVAVADGRVRTVTAPEGGSRDHSAVWSPAGDRIAFVRSNGIHTRDRVCVAAADGAALRVLDVGMGSVRGLDWVADEERLVLALDREGSCVLHSLSTEDGTLHEIPLRDEQVTYPSLSADLATLVYEEARVRRGLLLVSLDGEQAPRVRPFLRSSLGEREARFAPDGSRVAFVSDRNGGTELWLAGAGGESPRRLTESGAAVVGRPRWSPDWTRIAYQRTSADGDSLWVTDADGERHERVHAWPGDLQLSGWSRDGSALLFGAGQDGRWNAWRLALDGSATPVLLEQGASVALESADGVWLYHSGVDEPGIRRRPLAGGASEPVVADHRPRIDGVWSLAGDALLFTRATAEGRGVMELDCATGQVRTLFVASTRSVTDVAWCSRTSQLLVATAREGDADLDVVRSFTLASPR